MEGKENGKYFYGQVIIFFIWRVQFTSFFQLCTKITSSQNMPPPSVAQPLLKNAAQKYGEKRIPLQPVQNSQQTWCSTYTYPKSILFEFTRDFEIACFKISRKSERSYLFYLCLMFNNVLQLFICIHLGKQFLELFLLRFRSYNMFF